MQFRVARHSVAAAVAECIELLDIAKAETGLRANPSPQPDFKRPMFRGRKRSKRQCIPVLTGLSRTPYDQYLRLVVAKTDNGCVQTDLDL